MENVLKYLPDGEPAAPLRSPPHNLEAEQALLGAILVNNDAYQRVSEFLAPEHFAEPLHGRIFAAAAALIEQGKLANAVTLKSYFEQEGQLDEIASAGRGASKPGQSGASHAASGQSGAAYLARLALSAVTIINARDYGREIHDAYLRRQLIGIGTGVVNDAYEYEIGRDAKAQIEATEQVLFDLATEGVAEGGFKPFVDALTDAVKLAEAAYKRDGKTSGLSTGFRDLDAKLGGLHKSDLVILAGRPSMGKTALATNIAYNVAKRYRQGRDEDGAAVAEDGGIVGFFSLEMSAEQLAARVLAEESGVSGDKIRRGEVGRDDFEKFLMAAQTLRKVPLYIDDTPALTIAALRTRARRLKRRQGLDLIVIDYLQLLQSSARGGEQNRVQEISEITRGLKALAKDLDLPVLALSQLSRAVEQRDDKRPQLSDLRESGTIEQDSDVVMFVFREEYYLERSEPMRRVDETDQNFNKRYEEWRSRLEQRHGLAEVILAKQRHGPVGKMTLTFDGNTTKFGDHIDASHLPEAY